MHNFKQSVPSHDFRDAQRYFIECVGMYLGIPAVIPGEYRNPFHFLNEFDQWFEFEKRRRFDKESTDKIIASMLAHDLARAAKSMDVNYTQCKVYANEHFGRTVFDRRAMFRASSS